MIAPPSLGTVGDLTLNDPSYQLPIITKTEEYYGQPYQVSGHESQGNYRRYKPPDDMEDAQIFVPEFGSVPGQAFLGVYDGHGGPEVARWCKEHLHKYLLSNMCHGGDMEEILSRTFCDVNNTLKTLPEHEKGCTAAVALLRLEDNNTSRVLYCANVGDSKMVLCRGGQAIELSRVHNLSDLEERKRIESLVPAEKRSEVFSHIQGERVLGFNITRALGDHFTMVEYNVNDFLISTPHTTRTLLLDEDEFVIAVSDGVCNRLTGQEMITHARSGLASGLTLPQISEELVRFARERQRSTTGMVFDDATVLIMRFPVSS